MRSALSRTRRIGKGFTLIELLIVIAIILILVSIALPNFIEAQNRARVTRVKADQRSLRTALESYRADNDDYIVGWQKNHQHQGNRWNLRFPEGLFVRWRLVPLTTPIPYLIDLPPTPFLPDCYKHSDGCDPPIDRNGNFYNTGSEYNQDGPWYDQPNPRSAGATGRHIGPPEKWSGTLWHLRDPGPDGVWSNQDPSNGQTVIAAYNPTNGTKSLGDVWTFGP